MPHLEIKHLTLQTKTGRKLIQDLTLTVGKKDKLAIIGEEGNGKSTLLKAIYCPLEIQDHIIQTGEVKTSGIIGYLEQFLNTKWLSQTVEEYFLKDTPTSEVQYEKYSLFYELEAIFSQIGFPKKYIEKPIPISFLSGGEKVKLQMAKILWNHPDILLLDEPTNDLDLATLEWLEEFIQTLDKPIVYISHDETLLEKTANCILHLEQIENKTKARFTYEQIGYLEYVTKRNLGIQKQNQIAAEEKRKQEKQQEKWNQIYQSVAYKQENITRQNPSKGRLLAKKMKTVKAQQKRLEKKELTKKAQVEEAIFVKFHNEETIYQQKVILDWKDKTLKIGDTILKENLSLQVIGTEKIGVIGKNGSGKTTLLQQVYQELKQRKELKVGYMPQDYAILLEEQKTPIDFLRKKGGSGEETDIRTYLASMKLIQKEVESPIKELSGGQRAKLLLLKLILDKNNVLLLDEPTRNLSPLSNPVIRKLLQDFSGTIISVSHDRKYLEEVCDHLYDLDKQKRIS